MFGMQHTLKQFFGGIAIAAVVAVVAVPSAFSMTVITDTLGGNGSSKATPDAFERAVAIHNARPARQLQGVQLITDTLGGNGSSKATPDAFERAVAIHNARPARQLQGGQLITDTLGGNGHAVQPSGSNPVSYVNGGMSPAVAQSNQTRGRAYNPEAYVNGGASPGVAQAIQDAGDGLNSTSSVTGGSTGSGLNNWGYAGLAGGLAAALLVALLFLGGPRPRQHRRGVRTA